MVHQGMFPGLYSQYARHDAACMLLLIITVANVYCCFPSPYVLIFAGSRLHVLLQEHRWAQWQLVVQVSINFNTLTLANKHYC